MTESAPRTPTVADTLHLLRAELPVRGGADAWDVVLRHLRGPRVRAARVVRLAGDRPVVLGAAGDEEAWTPHDAAFARLRRAWADAAAAGGAGAPGDGVVTDGERAVVALRERGAAVAGLEVVLHERAGEDDRRELAQFAAAAEARLTERCYRLEAELTSRLSAANEVALDDGRDVASAALSLLVPRLRASTGALVAMAAVDTEVLAIHGYDPRVRERLLANRVPFGHGLVWRVCVDETPRLSRDYASDPDRFEAVVEHMEPVVLAYPLMHLGRARHALLLSFAPEEEPTHGELEVLARIAPVLAGLLATVRDRERHDRLLDFQYRALTQQVDDLQQAALALTIETVPGAECGSLLVLDPTDGTFVYRAVLGFEVDGVEPVRFTAEEMLAWYDPTGRVTEPREPRILTSRGVDLVRHAQETGATPGWARATKVDAILANLCIPVVEDDRVVAYLNLDNRRWERAFGADTLRVVERYAHPTATLLLGAIRHERTHAEAMSDPLTGLLNRRGFEVRAAEVLRDARAHGGPFTVLMMDLHGFKRVNDGLGHEAGDAILLRIAHALAGQARRGDVLARWGGDEFVAVLPDLGAEDTEALVARLQAAVRDLDPVDRALAIDIGAATYPHDGETGSALLQVADRRMYASKRRNRHLRP